MEEIQRVARLLTANMNILLTSHIRLDGDAVGSELALAAGLRQLGKRVQVVNDGPIPGIYRFLPGADDVASSAASVRGECDLAVVLDATAISRTGEMERAIPRGVQILNIDHHVSNERFGDVAWVDAGASSVGEMIYRLLKHMGVALADEIAVNLYAAIATDTGRFLHSNTSPEALRIVAEFLEAGINLAGVNHSLYRSMSFGLMKLRALATEGITLHADGRVACMRLTRAMFAETGTDPLDTQEFIEIPRSIQGVSVAVQLSELERSPRSALPAAAQASGGYIKVSFRSNHDVDVCAVARQFGGGGHVRAAGCEIEGALADAEKRVLAAVAAALSRSGATATAG